MRFSQTARRPPIRLVLRHDEIGLEVGERSGERGIWQLCVVPAGAAATDRSRPPQAVLLAAVPPMGLGGAPAGA